MNLNQWAIKWGVSAQALADLRHEMGMTSTMPESSSASTPEARVQSLIRLEASHKGVILWRNNVGATKDEYGNHIRYGLANDSQRMNASIKSSDLVGIRPLEITPQMVGATIGQFVSREVKRGGWQYSGTAREEAQLKWLNLILSLGGDAAFATDVGSI